MNNKEPVIKPICNHNRIMGSFFGGKTYTVKCKDCEEQLNQNFLKEQKSNSNLNTTENIISGSSKLTEAQIEHQIELDEEEDSYWMDDDEEDIILGYYCLGCGNIQNDETGFGCDRCMGHCLEPWYG